MTDKGKSYKKIKKEEICAILDQNFTYEKSSKMLNISPHTLRKLIEIYEIDTSKRKRKIVKTPSEKKDDWYENEGKMIWNDFIWDLLAKIKGK
jgi:hypothetical protein